MSSLLPVRQLPLQENQLLNQNAGVREAYTTLATAIIDNIDQLWHDTKGQLTVFLILTSSHGLQVKFKNLH